MNVVDHALRLASWGKPVFPCRENKASATPHGFHDATTDPAKVRAMWRRWPSPLIGLPTGAASGVDALDVDPLHGGDTWWLANAYRMPATRMHRTGSGGLHALFVAHDAVRCTIGTIAPGIDTRAAGGYVVWWPAQGLQVEHAPLAAWPAWLLKAMLKPATSVAPRPPSPLPASPSDAAQRMAGRVLDRLMRAPAGQRHVTLRKASFTIGGLLEHLPFGTAEAQQRLVHAVQLAGAEDLTNAAKTAAWGLARGRASPSTLGGGR